MANTPQNVTTLKDLLSEGNVQGTLKSIFEMGNMEMAKMYLDNLLANPNYKFAAKEPAFDMEFTTSTGTVTLSYSNNKVTMVQKSKQQEKSSLTDRIKNGTAPIDEIERALKDGSLVYKDFKEATENLDPGVSPYYRLLLTHENQVYMAKEAPAIKVTLSGGVLYTQEEREQEKKKREETEEAMKKEPDISPEDLRTIILNLQKPVSLEEQIIFNQQLLLIMNQIGTIQDPELMSELIGQHRNLGDIAFAVEDGKLVVQNYDDVIEDMEQTEKNKEISDEVLEGSHDKLDDTIQDLCSELRLNDAGALAAKKEEIRLEVEERIQDGEDPNKVLKDVSADVETTIEKVVTAEPKVTTSAPVETVVPEPQVVQEETLVEPDPQAIKREEIEQKTEKAESIIRGGQIPGPTMRKIIGEQFEGPNGQDPKKVKAREAMIKKLAENGAFAGYEKDLEGLQVGGIEFTKGGTTVQVEPGMTVGKKHDLPNAA